MASDADFARSFELLIGHEGSFGGNRNDPGNWTGGAVGQGDLKGTKYGVSAASYPALDIKNLTGAQAQAIYRRDYWVPAGCPDMPPRLAFAMFDCAVNNGVGRAVGFLQTALGVVADGSYGPQTRAALAGAAAKDPLDLELAAEVHARRIHFMAGLSTWPQFGLGWSRRLAAIPLEAAHHWPAV